MAKTDRAPIYKTKIGEDEPKEAKRGDVDGEWVSDGSAGTRKGGDRFKKEDDEGDFDEEYQRDWMSGERPTSDFRATDHPDPNDAKGWRRQYWRKKKREVPTS